MPSVITADKWIEIMEAIERKKNEKEEEREERIEKNKTREIRGKAKKKIAKELPPKKPVKQRKISKKIA